MKKIVRCDYSDIVASQELSSLTLKVLSNASLTKEQFDNLFISSNELPDNNNLKAVKERLLKAQKDKEKVFVFGDYDADGVCATTLMVRLLNRLNITNGYYIPNRLKEGYGLNNEKVQLAIDKGYSLIITVDNGVSALEALKLAKDNNIEVIVTDHHIISEDYDFDYLLHPTVFSDYFADMCGAATVLQLIRYFKLDDYLDWILAMVATIGDMMPLFFVNREIVKKGIEYQNKYNYLQIKCLTKKETIDEIVIGFDIVPAINTLGRLADRANPNNLVTYFLLEDENSIIKMANQISDLNKERQNLVKDMNNLEPDNIYKTNNYLVYVSNLYHEGIIGLLANKIMNEKQKNTLIFTKTNDLYKGSGRSLEGYDIFNNLKEYSELYKAFGGHAQACGLSIEPNNFMLFIDKLLKEEIKETKPSCIEAIEVSLEELTLKNVKELFSFKPFGEHFKLPLFYLEELKVNDIANLKNNYKKTVTYFNNEELEVMCFNSDYQKNLYDNAWHHIFVSLNINTFRGKSTVSLIVNDI